jgi:carbon-monoxide dehydrogenase medium subunit
LREQAARSYDRPTFPSRFEYFAPDTFEEALELLGRFGDEGKVLAGGQSLIPLLKLRFASPAALVDVNRLPDLDLIADDGGALRIGALVRHKACERSELLRTRFPLLSDAARQVSDPIVRNLGTVCGSLAHADPQGDWGSALIAAGAEVVARGPGGDRTIPLSEFFHGPFTSSLEPTEILREVRVPDPGPRSGGAYLKLERKVGDFATAAVGVQVSFDDGRVRRAGIALTGVGPTNIRAVEAEEALAGAALDDDAIRGAAELAAKAAQPQSDVRGSAEYKRHVVRVFTERALRRAAELASASEGDTADSSTGDTHVPDTAGEPETFSGEETVEGVMDELERKPGGPTGDEAGGAA